MHAKRATVYDPQTLRDAQAAGVAIARERRVGEERGRRAGARVEHVARARRGQVGVVFTHTVPAAPRSTAGRAPAARRTTLPTMGLHDLTATTIDGAELAMSELAGTPVLMCNVASR